MNLHGAQILVTRPKDQATELCQLIKDAGGESIQFPTLEIIAHQPSYEILKIASTADWLIFTSKNAVDFAILAFNGKIPASTQIAAIGETTANSLIQAGWSVDCVPKSEYNSEGLLAEPALQNVAGRCCVIVRGLGGREKIADTLRNRQAQVNYLEVYQRIRPKSDSQLLVKQLQMQQLSAITITSVEALDNLLAMLTADVITLLKLVLLVVVSDRIKQAAEELGFKRIAVTKKPTDAEILQTLMTLFNGENRGRTN